MSLKDLSKPSSLALVLGTTTAWFLTFSIQVRMNSWKKLFGAGVEVKAGADTRPGAGVSGPRAGRLIASSFQWAGGIVESGEWEWSGKQRVTSLAF